MSKPLPKLFDVMISFYSFGVYLELIFIMISDLSLIYKIMSSLAVLYFQAPLICRFFYWIYGPVPTMSALGKKSKHGHLWFVGHKLQEIYETFEFLERFLKTIPGLYSCWLRLWGAKIGKNVNWTSGCKLVDRPHIHIGDRSLIGNLSYLSAHAIKKKDGRYILFVKDIEIKQDVVISYAATIAPGVNVEANAYIDSGAVIYPNISIEPGQKYERFEELLNDRFNFLFKRN